jgi:hypothetical protein
MIKQFALTVLCAACIMPLAQAKPTERAVVASVVVNDSSSSVARSAGEARQNVYLMPVHLTAKQKQRLQHDVATKDTSTMATRAADSSLPAKVDMGMNNVPVLNQGQHGSCVTFAVTAALDAMIGKGDYISQLCSLELGDYLSSRGYFPSGWDGSNGDIVLHQFEQFGIVSKQSQLSKSCAGMKAYPEYSEEDTGKAMSLDEYKSMSENVMDYEAGKFLLSEPMLTSLQRFQWENSMAATQVVNNVKKSMALPLQGDAESKIDTRFILSVILPVEHCSAGACGRYKAVDDTWALSDEIMNDNDLKIGGHEMVLTGYDDKAEVVDHAGKKHTGVFTLRNSWSAKAGDNGNYYMTYDFFKAFVMDVHKIVMVSPK